MLNGLQLYLLKRDVSVPFQINITTDNFLTGIGTILECVEVLRLSPQRKIVCKAEFQGQVVVAKLFLHPDKAKKDQATELSSYEDLIKAQINTPKRLSYGTLNESGFYVLYEYIADTSALEKHISLRPDEHSLKRIKDLMPVIAQMHNSRIQQIDIHLNNFVLNKTLQSICIDCGDIAGLPSSAEDRLIQIHKNLAHIFSQLPIIYDQSIKDFLMSYQLGTVLSKKLSHSVICREINQWRQLRIQTVLDEASGNGRKFIYKKNRLELQIYNKEFSNTHWQTFYQQLDKLVENSPRLKSGKTTTVALAQCGNTKVVIKHYHTKGLLHWLRSFQQSDPAWKSWKNAHQLMALGIKTPKPIAIIVQHSEQLKNQAFYLSEYEPSEDALLQYNKKTSISKEHLDDFEQLFYCMIASRMSHGELKADNILLTKEGLSLVDLDCMNFYSPLTQGTKKKSTGFKKALRKDLQQFMKSWPLNSTMYQQFKQLLKQLPEKPAC